MALVGELWWGEPPEILLCLPRYLLGNQLMLLYCQLAIYTIVSSGPDQFHQITTVVTLLGERMSG